MTDGDPITAAARVDVGGSGLPLEVQRAIQQAVQEGSDLRGTLTEAQIAPPAGVVESTSEPGLMERVCRAIVYESLQSDQKPPNIAYALKTAGVNAEMYAQLQGHPDFENILWQTAWDYILPPRIPRMLLALSNKAMTTGDARAFRALMDQKDKSTMLETLMRQFQLAGDDALVADLEALQEDLAAAITEVRAPEPPRGLVEDALKLIEPQRSASEHRSVLPSSTFTGISPPPE